MAKAEAPVTASWLDGNGAPARWLRAGLLLLGLTVSQFVLYGPSLLGNKLLLPVDILARQGWLSSATDASAQPFNSLLSDAIFAAPQLMFAADEIRAGRLPLWTPHIYAGAPLASLGKYSPIEAMYYLIPSPVMFAWMQFAKAMIAGGGAYFFMRRVLRLHAFPSLAAAWCYPLTGFFIQWLFYPVSHVVVWFPWLLVAVSYAIRRPLGGGLIALAFFSAMAILAGQLDVAALALLGSGLYAIWAIIDRHGWRLWRKPALASVLAVSVGWGAGMLLAAPYMLPLLEYSQTGDRMARRSAGSEERPPIGLAALPPVFLPNIDGSSETGSVFLGEGNRLESSSSGYVSLIALLLALPLALQSRRHRSFVLCGLIFIVIGLAWCLDLPGFVWLFRQRGLNMLSYNRFVFFSAFFTLALAAIGLDVLWQRKQVARVWFVVPFLLSGGIAWYCFSRAAAPLTQIGGRDVNEIFRENVTLWGMSGSDALSLVTGWFAFYFTAGGILSLFAAGAWLILWRGAASISRPAAVVIGLALVADPLLYAWGANPQCDPALYYFPVPALTQLSQSDPHSRILGVDYLPANLAMAYGLRDIRGYDAVDPKRFVDLLDGVRHPDSPAFSYARIQWFFPRFTLDSAGRLKLPPLLDMLAVRHVLFPRHLDVPADCYRDGLTVLQNSRALRRAFIPTRVEQVADDNMRIALITSASFAPAEVAYVEEAVALPDECRGTAQITTDLPCEIHVDYSTESGGLLVLADLWDKGWHAAANGRELPILRTNHAFRGVVLPAGRGTVVFSYWPGSLKMGLWLALVSGACLLGWGAFIYRRRQSLCPAG